MTKTKFDCSIFRYYQAFAFLYGLVGSCADSVMCNSSWTMNHINTIWKVNRKTKLVFPPCNSEALSKIPFEPKSRSPLIISIGQFRYFK